MAVQDLPSIATNPTFLRILAALGAFYAFKQASGVSSFLYTHFLRPSSLKRYNRASDGKSSASWALVTGASDGIGKGLAEELCSRGFNIILHGRNEKKLDTVRQELLKQWPKREIKLLIFDAINEASNVAKLESTLSAFKDLDLRVLVNNVGGGTITRPAFLPLCERDSKFANAVIDFNLRFPTEITRLLLPQLIQNKPSLILNIGSLASENSTPYLCVYAGSKGYNKSWSASLGAELKAEGHDVEVKLIQTGMVSSGSEKRVVNLSVPSSRTFAKGSLDKVGNAAKYVQGYWMHEFSAGLLMALPTWVADAVLGHFMKKMREEDRAMVKNE